MTESEFERLVEEHQIPVFNLCYRMLGDRVEAEDAAQEAFIKGFRARDRYDPEKPFKTWILSIAANHSIDMLRKRRMQWLSLDVLDYMHVDRRPGSPERALESGQEREQVQTMLTELRATDRAAIVLRYWYDMSNPEIAQVLSLSTAAVRTRLHRARKALAQSWTRAEGDRQTQFSEVSNEPSTA